MNGGLDRVEKLKEGAKSYRDFQDYDEALCVLDEALEILKKEQELLGADPLAQSADYEEKIHRQLADVFGMKGGLFRRKAALGNRDEMLQKSEEMYLKGLKYERGNSYNLTNSIVLPILRNTSNLDRLRKQIEGALEVVANQVHPVHGKRKDQWWAWADLALLNILWGHLEPALNAYSKFRGTGARAEDYESTVSVLNELAHQFRSDQTMYETILKAIQYLETHKPRP